MSKVLQIISVMKTLRIVHFGILIHVFSSSVYVFIAEIIWQTFDVMIDDP